MPHADPQKRREYKKTRIERMRAAGTYVPPKRNKDRDRARYLANQDENRKKRKVYNAANVDKLRIQRNEWTKKNPDKVAAQKRRMRERHGERINSRMREFLQEKPNGGELTRGQIYKQNDYQKNGDKIRERARAHHMRSPRRKAILEKHEACGELCYICGLHLDLSDLNADHVHPLAVGGANDIQNLMPTHSRCNKRKSKRLNYPIVRPDLVEMTAYIQVIPRARRKTRTPEYA